MYVCMYSQCCVSTLSPITRLIHKVSTVSLWKNSSKVSYQILLVSDSTFFKLLFHIFAAIIEALIVAGHKIFVYRPHRMRSSAVEEHDWEARISCCCWRCTLCPCKVRNKFLVNFWNHTILLCITCITLNPTNVVFTYDFHKTTKASIFFLLQIV